MKNLTWTWWTLLAPVSSFYSFYRFPLLTNKTSALPNVKIPGMDQKIASQSNANGPWGSSGTTDPLEHDTIPTSAATTEAEWQSSFDASLYNPVSKPTISLSVVPKREGTFLFRHVNYIVEGTLPSTRLDKGRFKVIRRYSDFVWLLQCLQKKYPFRLLPILRMYFVFLHPREHGLLTMDLI